MELIIELSRKTIETMNIEKTTQVLNTVGQASALQKDGTFFVLEGYDDDPRELYEIEEVRKFFRTLIEADPDLFYSTLSLDRGQLVGVLFWTAVAFDLVNDQSQYSQYDCMEVMHSLGIQITEGPPN